MSDYKDTLNLPQTDFPMKANLPEREPVILKKWEALNIFEKISEARKGKPKFILHAGPPYANGHIHLGTATNNILKDIITKSKSLMGFDAPFVPGWDCHGLPIELNVEKKIGKPNQKVTASEFRQACREYANHFVDIQRQEFKRLGVIADWQHPYLTMDFNYEANIIRSLAKIIDQHHVQKGYKPVHWCLDCASALAEAEVEYENKVSPSIDVRFSVADPADFLAHFSETISTQLPIAVPIWTTTPWTLPANQAVALNAELNYLLVECDGREILLVAELLMPAVLERYGIKKSRTLAAILGKQLEGVRLNHPFYDKTVPIILGEHVTVETGTGAVHTAPAHGLDDFILAKKYALPLDNPIGDDGCFISSTPFFAGVHVNKANALVLEKLRERDTLLNETLLTHSYPHCWRHKTPLIFRATPQWFISMDENGLRTQALAAIDEVQWVPEWGRSRIYGMIQNRPDWCISRQRAWGVPITVFVHKETGALHPATVALMEKIALAITKQGIEAWYLLDIEAFLGKEAKQYQKVNDVLDVWFDSGVSHECVLKVRPELAFPADLVLEGSDQHRGWFQSSLLTSVAINKQSSYKEVLTHGFVVDGQGRKMSKSLGNVIAPEEVIRTLGADILRLWVASIDYRTEINASKEILNRMTEAYRRIRNTARFMLANLYGFDPAKHLVPTTELVALDRYAILLMNALQKDIITAFNQYQFHFIVQKIHHFCITDMGGFYLDIIKDRQYTMPENSRGRRSAQTALYYLIHGLVRWLAPIISFTAEEIWQFIPGIDAESVFLTAGFNEIAVTEQSTMDLPFWEKVREVRDAVNKEIETMRNTGQIGSALAAEVYLYCAPNLFHLLEKFADELRFVLITSAAYVIPEHNGPIDVISTDVPGLSLKIQPSSQAKCERCWHRQKTVNANADYPGLCARCVENVAGQGENRKYA